MTKLNSLNQNQYELNPKLATAVSFVCAPVICVSVLSAIGYGIEKKIGNQITFSDSLAAGIYATSFFEVCSSTCYIRKALIAGHVDEKSEKTFAKNLTTIVGGTTAMFATYIFNCPSDERLDPAIIYGFETLAATSLLVAGLTISASCIMAVSKQAIKGYNSAKKHSEAFLSYLKQK